MSLLTRLKKRKLVQWALAYLAGAFVVLQLMDALAEPLGLGVVGQRGVVVVLVVGLFVTLTLAWYHGEQGRQRVSGPELLILTILLLVAGAVVMALPDVAGPPGAPPQGIEVATGTLGPASVAVLPLTSATAGAEEAEFLAEGFHNEILTQLTKIGALEVVGRASVARYASTDKSPREIGEELGVANVLQGSLLRAADGVRLNVQLTESSSGRQLWAEAYARDFTMEGLFEILEDVAVEIAHALEVAVAAGERAEVGERPTGSPDAYEHYLRGELFKARGLDEEAIAAYERAVALDPAFAVAWARLSESAIWLFFRRADPQMKAKAAAALERARSHSPESPETFMASGEYVLSVDLDFEEAASWLERALRLRPNDAHAIYLLGRLRAKQGLWDEAERLLHRALALDPLHAYAAQYLGYVLRNTGRFSEAARYLDRAATLAPDDTETAQAWFRTYLWGLGDTTSVRRFIEHGSDSLVGPRRNARAWLAYINRDAELLRRIADEFPAQPYAWLYRVALLEDSPAQRAEYADSLVVRRTRALETALAAGPDGHPLMVPWRRSFLAAALAMQGDSRRAIREARLAVEGWPGYPLDRDRFFLNDVLTYTFLGRTDEALDRIEHELEVGSPQLTPFRLHVDPHFDSLRDHPRFQALLERYGAIGG